MKRACFVYEYSMFYLSKEILVSSFPFLSVSLPVFLLSLFFCILYFVFVVQRKHCNFKTFMNDIKLEFSFVKYEPIRWRSEICSAQSVCTVAGEW